MIGTQLGHYRLIALLGEGGMGRVYAADDLRLGRRVALKLLPEAALEKPDYVERFKREARLLAAVNHPTVVTVHSVEEADGKSFFVMEYIEGQSLQERVQPGGLAVDDLLAIAIPLAEALAAAHANGIVHRDLKPANVMLGRDGRLKVVDFGIAKPERQGQIAQTALTGAGLVLGTPAYMAPEQLRGEEVGPAADLFAYAVLMYELATGSRPFTGSSDAEMVTAVLRDTPAPLASRRVDLPVRLQAILDGCLRKNPAERTASAAIVARELTGLHSYERPITPPPAAAVLARTISALAVLPLQEVGTDVENLLADGITEALIANLARSSDLKVISRSSAMRFKGSTDSLQDIARRLGVDALVTGTVRRVGNRIRISVELVDADSERVLWADRYDRELEDVLRLQDDISEAIASGVQARTAAVAPQATPQRVDPEVYFLDLKGRSQVELRTEASFRAALSLFREAVARDPAYGPAHVGIARALNMQTNYGLMAPVQARSELQQALGRARSLGADPAEVLGESAQMRWQLDFDWQGAEAEFAEALVLAPNNARVWYWRSIALASGGQTRAGLDCLQRAESLDPLSDFMRAARGLILYFARDHAGSIACLRQVIEQSPDHSPTYWLLGMPLAALGDFDAAVAAYGKAIQRMGRISRLLGYLGHALARAGQVDQAQQVLAELRTRAASGYVPGYFFALVHAGLGDHAQALAALEQGWTERDSMLRDLRLDSAFDALQVEPGFQALLAAMARARPPGDATRALPTDR